MSQKANLITLKKDHRINEINLFNSKIWFSFFQLVDKINRLLYLKGLLLAKHFFSFNNNTVFINLFVYYQNSKIVFYKQRIKTKSQRLLLNQKNFSFLVLLKKYIKLHGYNIFLFKINNLNTFINKKVLSYLFNRLKVFLHNVFSRRFNLFIDFLKITSLFFNRVVDVFFYLKLIGKVFKSLSKRNHVRFLAFVKTVFNTLLEISENNKILEKQLFFIRGIKFLISGRLQGKARSSFSLIRVGSTPTQSFSKVLNYSSSHVYTLYGAFGLKMWVYIKKIY
jgi:hypothetical protein